MRRGRTTRPRVVLTGATSGIGRATALVLARRGACLALAARRGEVLEGLAEECRALGADAVAVPCDVSKAGDVDDLSRRAAATFGGFDVWINNAGVLAIGPLEDSPVSGLQRVIEVNLVGTMLGTRAAIAHFKQRGRGTVVNVGSLFSVVPGGFAAAYVASKHGVDGLAAAVRQELIAHRGVRVCNVLPAGVDTPILEHAANYSGKAIRPHYPLVAPERVARVIVGCMRRPRDSVLVGAAGRMQTIADAVAPRLHRRVIAAAASKALRRASPDAVTDGALFVSAGGDAAVRGGWRRRRAGLWAAAAGCLLAGGISYAATGNLRFRTPLGKDGSG